MFSETVKEERALQPLKAELLIKLVFPKIETLFKLSQTQNAYELISSTLLGISMETKLSQSRKAQHPIDLIVFGIVIVLDGQPLKPAEIILVTGAPLKDDGITKLL